MLFVISDLAMGMMQSCGEAMSYVLITSGIIKRTLITNL